MDAAASAETRHAAEADARLEAMERELEEELEEELELRVIERCGEAFLEDDATREAFEMELRAEGYGAEDRADACEYSLPWAELRPPRRH